MPTPRKPAEWRYEVVPGNWPKSWWIHVLHGVCRFGPDGGPYHCFGSQDRAVRKAERIIAEQKAKDDRRSRLTMEGP